MRKVNKMGMPNIPDIDPCINLSYYDTIKLLITSIALEELSLSHILNAEGDKLQLGLKMAKNLNDLFSLNNHINKTLRNIVKNQLLLHMKLEDTMELFNDK